MSWQVKPVGELFRVVNGGTPKTGVSAYWDGPHKWITPAEMGGLPSPHLAESRRTLTDEGLRVGAELVPTNSIILSSRAPIGHLVINEAPMAFNQGCKGLVPCTDVDTKFAYYFFLANVDLLESLGTGTTFKELSGGKLKEVAFHYPSFAEQHRIVALLDEAFAGITTAKGNAEENLKRACEILAAGIENQFAGNKVQRRLGDVCKFENGDRGKNYPGKQHRVSKGVPFINAGHLTDSEIDFSGMDYISEERFSMLGNGKVRAGDILFCLRGSLGKFASVGKLDHGAIASSLVILRAEGPLDRDYLLAFLSSRQCLEQVERFKGGAAQPNLGAKDLKQFMLPLPDLAVQGKVVDEIVQLRAEIASLQSLYTRKLAALDELKQSLLHRAFTGQL